MPSIQDFMASLPDWLVGPGKSGYPGWVNPTPSGPVTRQPMHQANESQSLDQLSADAKSAQPAVTSALNNDVAGGAPSNMMNSLPQVFGAMQSPQIDPALAAPAAQPQAAPADNSAMELYNQAMKALVGDPVQAQQTPPHVHTFMSEMFGIDTSPRDTAKETFGGRVAKNILGVLNSPGAEWIRRLARSDAAANAGAPAQVAYLSGRQESDDAMKRATAIHQMESEEAQKRFAQEQAAAGKRTMGHAMLSEALRRMSPQTALETQKTQAEIEKTQASTKYLGVESAAKARQAREQARTEKVKRRYLTTRTQELQARLAAVQDKMDPADMETLKNLRVQMQSAFSPTERQRIEQEMDDIISKYEGTGVPGTTGGDQSGLIDFNQLPQ